jgi:hypothetical protein
MHVDFAGSRTHDPQDVRLANTEDSVATEAQQFGLETL